MESIDNNSNNNIEKPFCLIDTTLNNWMFAQAEAAIEQAKKAGSNPLLIKPKNFSTVIIENNIHNRIEFDTSLDFSTIEEILVSEEIPVPEKKNYFYVTTVLFTKNKNSPLVFPYCYFRNLNGEFDESNFLGMNKDEKRRLKKKLKKKKINQNELCDWILVNNDLQESEHHIKGYSKI